MKVYEKHRCNVVAIEEVPRNATQQYGIVAGDPMDDGVLRVTDMVEKPLPADAPSNLAIIGRYVLTPEVFAAIEATPPGKNGEVQITDALRKLAEKGDVIAYRFAGTRFDCGSVEGFVAATNHCFQQRFQRAERSTRAIKR